MDTTTGRMGTSTNSWASSRPTAPSQPTVHRNPSSLRQYSLKLLSASTAGMSLSTSTRPRISTRTACRDSEHQGMTCSSMISRSAPHATQALNAIRCTRESRVSSSVTLGMSQLPTHPRCQCAMLKESMTRTCSSASPCRQRSLLLPRRSKWRSDPSQAHWWVYPSRVSPATRSRRSCGTSTRARTTTGRPRMLSANSCPCSGSASATARSRWRMHYSTTPTSSHTPSPSSARLTGSMSLLQRLT